MELLEIYFYKIVKTLNINFKIHLFKIFRIKKKIKMDLMDSDDDLDDVGSKGGFNINTDYADRLV